MPTLASIRLDQAPQAWQRLRVSWHRLKHGYTRRRPLLVRNGIRVSHVHVSSMIQNTCCTALLLQGAPPSSSSTPP